jgi:hypothetical protein
MSTGAEQRKLAAIMFTDMVGYSALAQRNVCSRQPGERNGKFRVQHRCVLKQVDRLVSLRTRGLVQVNAAVQVKTVRFQVLSGPLLQRLPF